MTLISTVGGASGPLYGTAFLKAAEPAGHATEIDGTDPRRDAHRGAGRDRVARQGASPGDKTMVDAWTPAVDAAAAANGRRRLLATILDAAADAAEAGAVATEPLVARKGRASYLGERSAGHRDPGAQSTASAAACRRRRRPPMTVTEGRHRLRLPQCGARRRRRRARPADGAVGRRWWRPAEPTTAASARASPRSAAAIAEANAGAGVVVVSDLGSALLTAETVHDMLAEEERASRRGRRRPVRRGRRRGGGRGGERRRPGGRRAALRSRRAFGVGGCGGVDGCGRDDRSTPRRSPPSRPDGRLTYATSWCATARACTPVPPPSS